jgi:hypothetical protein
MLAVNAGIQAGMATWSVAGREYPTTTPLVRHAELLELWSRYQSTVWETTNYSALKGNEALYRYTRSLVNPVRQLCDFYAGLAYPGRCRSARGPLPEGYQDAIPLDCPEELAVAIAQWWEWAGWQSEKSVFVRYGAAQGSVLCEVVDDWQAGKVSGDVWRADYVADITLDRAGNVKAFTLEYPSTDADGVRYLYARRVTNETVATFRDGKPYAYGDVPSLVEHGYGFCPAVWARHMHTGSDFGSPAIAGSLGLVDELNSAASVMLDTELKRLNAPMLVKSKQAPTRLGAAAKRGPTDQFAADAASDRELLPYLHTTDTEASVDALWNMIGGNDALGKVEWLRAELDARHPEIPLWRQLRAMTQVTGPGAARMVGDVTARMEEPVAGYDRQSAKLFGMSVAVGGMRFREGQGGWARRTAQQQYFAPFDLSSYEKGDLELTILPRPLLPETRQERAQRSLAEGQAAQAWVAAGMALPVVMAEEFGWDDEQIAELGANQLAAIRTQQALAQRDAVTGIQQ